MTKMLEQEIALMDKAFGSFMRWCDALIKTNHKMYLELNTDKNKKRLSRFIVISYISCLILSGLLICAIFGVNLNPVVNILLGTIVAVVSLPFLFEINLKKSMNYKSLLNLHRLVKELYDVVVVRLKNILEYDLLTILPNYEGYKASRSMLEQKLRIYSKIQRTFTKKLKITSVLQGIDIILALLIIVFIDPEYQLSGIFFLAFISGLIIIVKFSIDLDRNKIKIKVNLDRFFGFFDYLIQNESFSIDMAEKYLSHYYYYDYSRFKFNITCNDCYNIIGIEDVTQRQVYCSVCNKDVEIADLFVYVDSFTLDNLCIRCGHNNTFFLSSPYDTNITCEQCGLVRGKLYPPMYLEIIFSWLEENDQIGMIISSNNYGDLNYHYILFIDKDQKILIPIPSTYNSNFLMTIPLSNFKEFNNNNNKVNKYEWIEKSIGENIDNYNFPTKVPDIESNKVLTNNLKGTRLEHDMREMLERRDNYIMKNRDRDVKLSIEDRILLNREGCLKNMSTTEKEMDLIGTKDLLEEEIIVIGECTYTNRPIPIKKIKKFIITANILAEQEINKKKEKQLEFHLIIASYSGFPDENVIQKLLEKFWTLGIEKIINKKIELLDVSDIIRLFKQYNISCTPYLYRL